MLTLQSNDIFPEGFVLETLKTLALLFPPDTSSRRWYRKQEDPNDLDPALFSCGSASRQIEEYQYWHDRLVILKEEFDSSSPTSIWGLWNDRRTGIQWYALWLVLILTIFFGLIQSIEGGVQAYAAWHTTGA
jgi:hypothetical protein